MTIHETIKAGIPDAMRAKDEVRLRTLRSLVTAMTNEVVAKKRKPDEFLTDEEALTVLKRAQNQRKDSISQFEAGGRSDLAEPEKAELVIIEVFLPAQMSREEIEVVARERAQALGDLLNERRTGEFQIRGAEQTLELDFVRVVIAANQDGDGLVSRRIQQRLDELSRRHL